MSRSEQKSDVYADEEEYKPSSDLRLERPWSIFCKTCIMLMCAAVDTRRQVHLGWSGRRQHQAIMVPYHGPQSTCLNEAASGGLHACIAPWSRPKRRQAAAASGELACVGKRWCVEKSMVSCGQTRACGVHGDGHGHGNGSRSGSGSGNINRTTKTLTLMVQGSAPIKPRCMLQRRGGRLARGAAGRCALRLGIRGQDLYHSIYIYIFALPIPTHTLTLITSPCYHSCRKC